MPSSSHPGSSPSHPRVPGLTGSALGLGLCGLGLCLGSGVAVAAPDVTDIAPVYRGDLTVAYTGTVGHDVLVEGGVDVGERTLTEHRMDYRLNASLLTGLGLVVEIPHWVEDGIGFTDGQQMEFDPLNDDGTLVGTSPMAGMPVVSGGGLGGTWIGVRGAPFHQEAFKNRVDRFSWVLEAGYRFKDKSSFWGFNDSGARGGGPGASALRLVSSFSTTYNRTSPYLSTSLVRTGRITTTANDATGVSSGQELVIRPSSTMVVTTGAEIMASEYGEDGGRVAVDLRSTLTYNSWQDVPSGLFLPSVLDASRATIVTQDETISLTGGVGVNWRMVDYLQLNVGGGAGVTSPHQLEHLYDVSTGLGAWQWYVATSLRFRARDPLVSDVFGG